MSVTSPDRYSLVTFGCQMNKLDSELVATRLIDAGWEAATSEDEAGLVLINTCSVRENAEDRVWGRLGALLERKRRDPGLIIGVLGCMAQEHRDFIQKRMPHVDLVCGTNDFGSIDSIVAEVRRQRSPVLATEQRASGDAVVRNVALRPSRAQAYVNVIRGCNMPCTYCIVPQTRGAEVSRPVDAIVDEVARLVADGVTEVTLLGQTVDAYGHDLEKGTDLALLLRELHAIPALRRLSFITSHPNFLRPRLMETMAELPRVSRYFHLPAQSGSNRMLKAMKRGYSVETYLDRIRTLRSLIPEMEFASDFIVGFPGESEDDHQATLALVEEAQFSQSFVFQYSPRPRTAAAETMVDDVPQETKKRRNHEVLAAQERIGAAKNRALVGQVVEVLVEGTSKSRSDRMSGRCSRNRLVHFEADDATLVGRYVPVRIEQALAHSLVGSLLPETSDTTVVDTAVDTVEV